MYKKKSQTNKNEGVFSMTAALLEKERVEYINDMKAEIERLKTLPQKEAKKDAKQSLIVAGIITSKGELVSHYKKNLKLAKEG